MAVTPNSMMAKLKQWETTADAKDKMDDAIKRGIRTGVPFASSDRPVTIEEINMMANDLRNMIVSRIPQSLSKIKPVVFIDPPTEQTDWSYVVNIHFWDDDLHRDSVENDETDYDGIENILALFNNGYIASGSVYGWWNGHRPTGEALSRGVTGSEDYAWIKTRPEREGLRFMQDARDEFLAKYGSKYTVKVKLGSDYEDFQAR